MKISNKIFIVLGVISAMLLPITSQYVISSPAKRNVPKPKPMQVSVEDFSLINSIFSGQKYKKQDKKHKVLAADLIRKFEGFYSRRYRCPGGKITIGYGLTKDGVETCKRYGTMSPKYTLPKHITQDEAEHLLIHSIIPAYNKIVDKYVKVKLNANQRATLISFTYNCGEGALAKLVSEQYGRLNAGNYNSVERILPMYVKANGKKLRGLERRRQAELEIWTES